MIVVKKYDSLKKLNDKKFKRAVGIPRELFEIYVLVIIAALKEKHKKRGRNPKLKAEDLLLLMFYYYRDYDTYFKLGVYFDIDESNAYRWIKWCEEILQNYSIEPFDSNKLSEKKEYIVDVMECPIERPKDKEMQKEYYSGKKKKHTIKIQIIIESDTKKILYVAFDKGSIHDFNLFKNSTKDLSDLLKILADSGYQGIQNLFKNSLTPKKKSKNNPLTAEDKELNHLISSNRIAIEHVNSQLKVFKILSVRYRSRINSFIPRAIFICSLYNYSL